MWERLKQLLPSYQCSGQECSILRLFPFKKMLEVSYTQLLVTCSLTLIGGKNFTDVGFSITPLWKEKQLLKFCTTFKGEGMLLSTESDKQYCAMQWRMEDLTTVPHALVISRLEYCITPCVGLPLKNIQKLSASECCSQMIDQGLFC